MQQPAEIPRKAAVGVGRIGRALAAVVRTVWDGGYRLSYVVGIQALRYGRRAGRRLAKIWRPAGGGLRRYGARRAPRAPRDGGWRGASGWPGGVWPRDLPTV